MNPSAQIAAFILEELLDGECDVDIATEENLLLTGLIDSLGVMRLVAWIEQEFDQRVLPEDITLENFLNVEAMVSYIGAARS